MSNDLRSWFVTFPNGMIPLVENWGLKLIVLLLFFTLMLCKQSDQHDYHSRYRAPGTFRPAEKSIRSAGLGCDSPAQSSWFAPQQVRCRHRFGARGQQGSWPGFVPGLVTSPSTQKDLEFGEIMVQNGNKKKRYGETTIEVEDENKCMYCVAKKIECGGDEIGGARFRQRILRWYDGHDDGSGGVAGGGTVFVTAVNLDEEQWGLVAWVQDSIKEGNLKNIIDSDIRGEISPKCLKEYVKLAERCLHNSPKHRPTMAEILFSLESVMAIQERFNNSFQYASRTLFGRMVNLFPFPSNQENSVQGDLNLSTTSKGNNMLPHMKEVPAHFPSPSPILKEFRLSDLEKTTGSFSPDLILGEGGFGKAQQRKPSRSCRMAKVNVLGHLAHPNIIRLLGYCREELEHLLDFNAKLRNFGMMRCGPETGETHVTTSVRGTIGYIAPEYYATGVCRAVDRSLDEEQWGLVTWVQDSIKEGNLKNIIDLDIRGEISPKCLKEYVKLTERCLHNSPKYRPTMAEILFSLESVMAIQERLNNSLQSASRTLFGRMVNLFPFSSNQENSVQGNINLSTTSKGNNMFPHMKEDSADFTSPSPILKEFRFSDLKKATRSFSPDLILGEGGFGKVFLGWVEENTLIPSKQGVGMAVAVKRLSQGSNQGVAEWQAELNLLGHLAHPNIIRLLGYSTNGVRCSLVYQYMPNKSFDRYEIFSHAPDIAEPLSWGTRLVIMIGVARGLAYLHSKNIIHRDLKSSHILLDEDFNAKLGGFGLARNNGLETWETSVTTKIVGSFGYIAPEYMETGHVTTMCDIYSFGVLLLESITGRNAVDAQLLGHSCWIKYKENKDPRLEGKYPLHGASEYVALALKCVAGDPKNRPSGEETVEDEIDEGEATLEPIIFEDVIDDEDQSEEDGDAMETDVEDNEEFHEAVSNVSDDDIEGSDGMVDY
ncbi:hypothetical protein E3N88_23009 [Mikania micrantha]|uniref:Protein kinase domain-containing protein n=1 Tax=Mikania micrantha TaxID=192012 RepID=A0A5N6NEK4_9ASTR|nr:hypothetical protein E3N88_23009 [Mikania micrantha]